MKLIIKVERNGIVIPKERLQGINEGDIVQIEIERLYMSKRTKKDFIQALNFQ
jgi:bifunctional DNA-binding transcriptional regulator/antitoxin component of YhaV-PrlF toxin-antitoxin module